LRRCRRAEGEDGLGERFCLEVEKEAIVLRIDHGARKATAVEALIFSD
jgi:hypothetical protein